MLNTSWALKYTPTPDMVRTHQLIAWTEVQQSGISGSPWGLFRLWRDTCTWQKFLSSTGTLYYDRTEIISLAYNNVFVVYKYFFSDRCDCFLQLQIFLHRQLAMFLSCMFCACSNSILHQWTAGVPPKLSLWTARGRGRSTTSVRRCWTGSPTLRAPSLELSCMVLLP